MFQQISAASPLYSESEALLPTMSTAAPFADAGDGCANDISTHEYANGDVYEGGWKDGKREGRGKMTFADGQVYEGDFKSGTEEGHGIRTYATHQFAYTYRPAVCDRYEGQYSVRLATFYFIKLHSITEAV